MVVNTLLPRDLQAKLLLLKKEFCKSLATGQDSNLRPPAFARYMQIYLWATGASTIAFSFSFLDRLTPA